MAKIECTKAGAEALRKLSVDLQHSNEELSGSCQTLLSKISVLGGLGDFTVQIEEIAEKVSQTQRKGRDAVETLSGKLMKLANQVESISSSI